MDHGDGVAHSFDLLDLFCGKQAMSKVWSWPKKKTYDKTSTKHVNQSCFLMMFEICLLESESF